MHYHFRIALCDNLPIMTELKRHFTKKSESPFAMTAWTKVKLANLDFEVEAPAHWSDTAVEIAVSAWLCRASIAKSVACRAIHKTPGSTIAAPIC